MASARQAVTRTTPARKNPLRIATEVPSVSVPAGQEAKPQPRALDSPVAARQPWLFATYHRIVIKRLLYFH
jgi:hypothetical protein